ncbi:MAG: AAC(3) family N-acetyltransferase [Asgard group archaeon]|nr:AAC(3) family N-acetyltransferase [Asgard group archaeon]
MKSWEKEKLVVEKSKFPITKDILVKDLKKIGLQTGDIVIVHSSLSNIGWVIGDAITVINALMEVLTKEGTLVMPTMTSGNTDPENWNYPPVPNDWKPIIRQEMPPYKPNITPTRGMGRIPELFRILPNVHRSNHPQSSFSAWGKHAKEIVSEQTLESSFGHDSPLRKAYDLNSKILLLGVPHSSNTSLHYAEVKAELPNHPVQKQGAALFENGKRVWKSWKEIQYDSDDFEEIGLAYEKSINYQTMKIGLA